jgi:hypothetical protein
MRLVATSLLTPVDREDEIAAQDARLLSGRSVEDAQHLQPAPILLDVHPDALELAAHRLVELGRLLRRQVVAERILERVDDPLERRVVQLLLVHLLVEVVLDRVDDLRAQGSVLVHEGILKRARKVLGMPAEPDADEQREHRA